MINTIDVVSTIPTPLTLQEEKIVAVYHAIRVFRHQSGYSSKPDWQKQLLLKTVSSIQALGVYSALCSTNET